MKCVPMNQDHLFEKENNCLESKCLSRVTVVTNTSLLQIIRDLPRLISTCNMFYADPENIFTNSMVST